MAVSMDGYKPANLRYGDLKLLVHALDGVETAAFFFFCESQRFVGREGKRSVLGEAL